ncbi:MAG TPA: SH3 domain-containing protein [Pseudoduganella sp.]|jgi:hypothetical protein
MFPAPYHGALAYALGLALALALAPILTPARWWRRPTARGIVILGGGAWAFGALLLYCLPPGPQPDDAAAMRADAPAQQLAQESAQMPENLFPAAGRRYRVHRDLNVRDAAGVGAARLAVVPAGSFVTPTGIHEGDWWQIRYAGAGAAGTGWASSLWLRRAGE